jgi:hypothetical protein
MALRDAFRSLNRTQAPFGLGNSVFDEPAFTPTELGNPDFTLAGDPRSQAQYPAAAAEKGLYSSQVRAENQLAAADSAGLDTSNPLYDPLSEVAEEGFASRALTFGEKILSWVDGPRQAVNLMIQDLVGGAAEEGFRNPDIGDYWNTLWGGMEDSEGFKFATGLEPRSGSKTLDMFGWSEEEDLVGRIGRGVADFGLQVLTDPVSYLTFGMSALGKNVARATGGRFMDDVTKKLLPAFDKAGDFKLTDSYLTKLQASDTYTYNLARELMEDTGDGFVSQFRDDLLTKIEAHGGTMPPDMVAAMRKRIGDENNWFDNIVELAVANRVTKDVIQPLMARDFAKIDKAALEMLPKWAYGGARIAVPFTQSTLESGWLIPGSQGLGKKIVGDPLRKLSERTKGFGLYDVVTKNADEGLNFLATERSLNKALASGRMAGWQYAIAKPALDNMANQATREALIASLNTLGKRVVEAADTAGIEDQSLVWSKVMHILEGFDTGLDDMMLGGLDDITGGTLRGAAAPNVDAFADDLLRDDGLDDAVNNLATFLRGTFDEYHAKLSVFDPELKKRYIDNYAPHSIAPDGRKIVSLMSRLGKGIPKREWEALQKQGDPGGVLVAHILNAAGKGGRLEASMGGSRYFNPRDEGKLAALALTDDGGILLRKDFWAGLQDDAATLIGEGGVVNPALKTKYAPASKLNEWVKPVIEKLARENNISLPKGWDGKLFSEDPLELAIGYIRNLDEVVRTYNVVEGFRAAGLAFKHDQAPDVVQIMNNMYDNMMSNTMKITSDGGGLKPKSGLTAAPVDWVKSLGDPNDLSIAQKGERPFTLESAVMDMARPAGQRKIKDRVTGDLSEFTASVESQGVKTPIVIGIDNDGLAQIVDGHGRIVVAERLGLEEVPIKFQNVGSHENPAAGQNVREFLKDTIDGENLDAIDVFNTLPWKPGVKETKRVLKGYGDMMGATPVSVTGPLAKAGWDANDMAGNARIFQMARMSSDDFLALRQNPMKADGALVDKATGGYQNLRRISGDMTLSVNSKAKRGWQETTLNKDRVVYTFRDDVGKPRGDIVLSEKADGFIEADFTVNPNLSPRQQLAFSRELIEKFDELVTAGPLKGKFTHKNIERTLKEGNISDAGGKMMQLYLRSKLRQLPPRALEEIAKEPAEFANARMLADDFIDEFNMFFKEYAQVYDPSNGRLIIDPNKVQIAGDDVVRKRIADLRRAARMSDEAGWETASKIMNGIDDTMGLSQVDDFVNPGRFAMGGPAIEGLAIQRDMAMWLRNYARNAASAYTPEGVAALNMASKTSLRWWKAMATIARPTFHIRNHISATWANMTIGVRPQDYALVRDNAIIFKRALREGLTEDEAIAKLSAKAQPYFRAAWDHDIMSGFVTSELRTLVTKAEKLSWARVHDVDNFVLPRMGGHVMESIEDFHRMAAFTRWYDPANPSSADVAKAMVERVHFNYANTTPLEDRLKSLVPFFVWTRRNIPLQVSTLMENPRVIQRYRAMMQSLNDEFSEDGEGLPIGDQFSAYAAGTDYYVNKGTPFWGRMILDPDLPVKDLLALPNLSPPELLEFGNGLLGPHLSSIINLNEEREFGDVNAPAPLNAVLRSLAFVGLYDATTDGDVRMPYWARTIAETAFPPSREIIDPLTGGPSDPNRQARLGIAEDDSTLEASLKTLMGTIGRGFGVKLNTPADVRGVNARTQEELNMLIQDLRLKGQLPPSELGSDQPEIPDVADLIFGGGG